MIVRPVSEPSQQDRSKIEHRIADLTRYCGMRRSRYRGLVRTKVHVLLAAIASNVKRMARLLSRKPEPLPPEPALAA